ncbi:sigma-54-dependent transcriptional regulator [Desulfoluna spongiiphila]|uniref:Two-component system, NtrC family, response regulator n=1 Tax=Desulfoluna spongiiphila TaxID=419481 RepID=A0A1G5H0Z8_9BACT|nr:sigma-54 dependent transcriptional regulator [Desulfoluna spongiiphila]SCY57351.1 two-component system, NtrC family, response regulator [Desulfoluna spongiiphila]
MTHSDLMHILVVDDEKSIRRLIEKEMASPRRVIKTAGSGDEAFAAIRRWAFDVILLDIRLPDANGLELMAQFQEDLPGVQVILITGYGEVHDAVEAMKNGACDYITKPFDLDALEQVVEKAFQHVRARREAMARQSGGQAKRTAYPQEIIGHSGSMDRVRFLIDKVSPVQVPVLITGESGTGKNVVARVIHRQSARAEKPLITKNCATLQAELVRSELFGHCKGAFTGATESRDGLLSMAHEGTLFLDEIGELPVGVQATLLRVMETQTFRRVGEKEERKVDVRFLFATNRNLRKEVDAGRFREDLYHRLNVFNIELLPLRERREEIPVLLEYFLEQLRVGKQPACRVSKKVMQCLMNHDWPGNVRELHNVIERGVILAEDSLITEQALPAELLASGGGDGGDDPFLPLKEIERKHMLKVLEHVNGNRSKASELLGVSRKTLYRKLLEP